jgi:hypothetical protein
MATIAETQETVAELRGRLQALRQETGHSWAQLAPMIGLPSGTLTPWVNGKYQGDNFRIAGLVRRFLDSWEKRQDFRDRVASDPGFLETPTAQRLLNVLSWAHTGEVVAIAATPGTGKTVAAEEYRSRASNVWIATARPSAGDLKPFLLLVSEMMGIETGHVMPQQLSSRIIDRLAGSRGLVIIDEAQELTVRAIDEARSWHDATGVGIAFVGDERVIGQLSGTKARQLARLHSRISMRVVQAGPREDDARIIADGWGIHEERLKRRLVQLSQKPGGLRGVAKVIKLASLLASGEGRDIGIEDIDEAWRQLGYDAGALLQGGAK